jgi:hypothetical protein
MIMRDSHELDGLFCQSCGKPMLREGEHGTTNSGARATEYCSDCYRDGRFTEPEILASEMVNRTAMFLRNERGWSGPAAKALAESAVPRLRRWSSGLAA